MEEDFFIPGHIELKVWVLKFRKFWISMGSDGGEAFIHSEEVRSTLCRVGGEAFIHSEEVRSTRCRVALEQDSPFDRAEDLLAHATPLEQPFRSHVLLFCSPSPPWFVWK